MTQKPLLVILSVLLALVTLWSVIKPHDYPTWLLEASPAVVGWIVLLVTYKRFPFTSVVYVTVFLHSLILLTGAHYTYAEVPYVKEFTNLFIQTDRNHFDRLGHFAQGFTPALIARELLLRTSPLERGKWLKTIVVAICLAISAVYELLEWLAAVLSESGSVAFLATQGDVWDTQKDMALCGLGAMIALICFSRLQDRQMRSLQK